MPVPKNGRLVHFINNLKMYETNQGSLNFDGSGIWVRPLELIRVVPRGKMSTAGLGERPVRDCPIGARGKWSNQIVEYGERF